MSHVRPHPDHRRPLELVSVDGGGLLGVGPREAAVIGAELLVNEQLVADQTSMDKKKSMAN